MMQMLLKQMKKEKSIAKKEKSQKESNGNYRTEKCVAEMKSSLNRFNSRVDMTEDGVNESEDKSIAFPHSE